jgi:Na+-transporting NADH:ubiquinone oxidoreductase subunit NqrF
VLHELFAGGDASISYFQWWWFIGAGLGRTILGSVRRSHIVPNWVKRHGKMSFWIVVRYLKKKMYSQANFQYLLHQFTVHFSTWILIQSLNWIEIEFSWFEISSN